MLLTPNVFAKTICSRVWPFFWNPASNFRERRNYQNGNSGVLPGAHREWRNVWSRFRNERERIRVFPSFFGALVYEICNLPTFAVVFDGLHFSMVRSSTRPESKRIRPQRVEMPWRKLSMELRENIAEIGNHCSQILMFTSRVGLVQKLPNPCLPLGKSLYIPTCPMNTRPMCSSQERFQRRMQCWLYWQN